MLVTRPRLIAAGLLIGSATLFAAGGAYEHASGTEAHHHDAAPTHSSAAQTSPGAAATTGHADGDTDAGNEAPAAASSTAEPTPTTAHAGEGGGEAAAADSDGGQENGHAEPSEKLLGINPESTTLIVTAVAVSVLLALALLVVGSPLLAAAAAAAMVAFTVLDVREVAHQIDISQPGVATVAAIVALLHLLAAGACVIVARRSGHRAANGAALGTG